MKKFLGIIGRNILLIAAIILLVVYCNEEANIKAHNDEVTSCTSRHGTLQSDGYCDKTF